MITCIVQARMGSERLSGKVLKEINGKPMILHVLDRVSKSQKIDQVILATSDLERDTPLAEAVSNAGYNVFRGSEDNVLSRYVDALEFFSHSPAPNAGRKSEQALASSPEQVISPDRQGHDTPSPEDTVIRITGDCPLIDPTIIDDLIEQFEEAGVDYLTNDVPNTVARGFDAEVFTKKALLKTAELANEPKYLEHVTHYIYTHKDEFSVKIIKGEEWQNRPYRLCVDTAEDFELVTKIYEHFNDHFISAQEVIAYLDNTPELATINTEVKQGSIDLVTDF